MIKGSNKENFATNRISEKQNAKNIETKTYRICLG